MQAYIEEMLRNIRRKILLLASLLLLLMIVCCCQDSYRERLKRVNVLTEDDLCDSALHELKGIKYGELDRKERALYNLLEVKAMYRSYKILPSDSLIDYSIATFLIDRNDSLLADAYYYKGAMVSDREKDEGYVKVVACLNKAERIARKRHYTELLKKIYDRHSCYCMVVEKYPEAYVYALKLRVLVDSLNNDNYYKAYGYSLLLKSFYTMNMRDSVERYYPICMKMLKYIPNKEKKEYLNDVFVALGIVDLPAAIRNFERLVQSYPTSLTLSNLACLYCKQGRYQKADSLWQRALCTRDLFDKAGTLADIVKFKRACHQYQDAMQAQVWLDLVKDSLQQQYIVREFENYDSSSELVLLRLSWQQNKFWMSIWFLLIIVIAFFAFFFILRRLHTRIRHYKEQTLQLEEMKQLMEIHSLEDKSKIEMMEKSLEKLKEKHAQTFSHGRDLYEQMKDRQCVLFWTKQDFIDFIDYYMSVDFRFLQKVHQNYHSLTPSEIFYLILVHEGYNDESIKEVLSISNTALRVRKSRLNKKRGKLGD